MKAKNECFVLILGKIHPKHKLNAMKLFQRNKAQRLHWRISCVETELNVANKPTFPCCSFAFSFLKRIFIACKHFASKKEFLN